MEELGSTHKSEFIFRNVNVSVKDNHIIRNAAGKVETGEILAVLGPSGSGKSALVSTLGGLLKPYIGEVTLNGEPTRRHHNKIGFVQTIDRFLPTLTVKETLVFTARLRLQLDETAIMLRIKQVIDLLHLEVYLEIKNCQTLSFDVGKVLQIATPSIKKRLSIACEMLMDPVVLIIDEPITNLDYKDGLDLMRFLRYYMNQYRKIGVVSLRACPSGVYQTCTKALMLYRGHTVFYGDAVLCEQFLQHIGVPPVQHYYPYDYLLELLNEDNLDDTVAIQDKIIEAAYKWRNTEHWPDYCDLSKRRTKSPNTSKNLPVIDFQENNNGTPKLIKYDKQEFEVLIDQSHTSQNVRSVKPEVYPTSFCSQFWTLFSRNFTNARRRILFPISVIQNLYILVICILVWWQPERTEETVKDRLGLFFFTVVQWAFFALLDGILTFPKEIKVINKERKYHHYRLSAFCLSKTLSEIPLAVIQPCVYLAVIYWVANLSSVTSFVASMGVLMLDVLAAQSIGMFIGAALRPPWTVTMVPLGLLSMMLWGGAFNTPPTWFQWGRFASFFFYGLNAFIYLEFKGGPPIRCGAKSNIPVCNMIDPSTNATYTHFDSDIVLLVTKVEWPLSYYLAVLIGIFIVTKLLWYIAMRRRKSED